jgi:hypothetical protein
MAGYVRGGSVVSCSHEQVPRTGACVTAAIASGEGRVTALLEASLDGSRCVDMISSLALPRVLVAS